MGLLMGQGAAYATGARSAIFGTRGSLEALSKRNAISSYLLLFVPPIFTPHDVGGFSLGGAALLSSWLKEGAGEGTISCELSGKCALGLPPMPVLREGGPAGVGGSGRTGLPFVPNKLGGGRDADRSVPS